MKITRKIKADIENDFFKGKVIIIYGARQVGKTTLLNEIREKHKDSIFLNCDEPDSRNILENKNSTELIQLIGNTKVVLIDEAQRVKNIGLTLKILADTLPHVQVVATGSSSFDLANEINEPLTGRNFKYHLFSFSSEELSSNFNQIEMKRLTEQRLIYGSYPEPFFMNKEDRERRLLELANDYAFKDIFSFKGIKNNEKILNLTKALALQIGSEVSYTELGRTLEMNYNTVMSYITLLEQSFIVFKLPPYFRNKRKSIRKSRKIYFWDNGIRNALINNFNSLDLRTDVGALFENLFISEMLKKEYNRSRQNNAYFWRDYDQKEIDLILEEGGKLKAFECKYSNGKISNATKKTFLTNHPDSDLKIVTKENYLDFTQNNN